MSKVDPTGFQAALATIQPGQLSERQQRIAAAIGMVQSGSSANAAAKSCGIARATLHRYVNGLSDLSRENDGGRGRDLDAIHEASIDASLIAAERLRESLIHDDWRPGDLVKAYGVATDKVIALAQRTTEAPMGIRELFSAVLAENDITISKRDPAVEAIEIEAGEIG